MQVNEKVLALDNDKLEEAMRELLQNKTQQNMSRFMNIMRDARFLVPVEFPKNVDKEVLGRIVRGEKVSKEEMPRMLPVIIRNQDGVRYAPAFTSRKHLPDNQKYQAILNVDINELLRVSSEEKLNLEGILINPETDKMILHQKFIETMKKVKEGLPNKREIRMTREQFVGFSRRNIERGLFPRLLYKEREAFMTRLEEEKEKLIYSLYRQPYGDKIPCPYSEEDFGVMILNISDETCVASIEVPTDKLSPQMALSIYLIWNPKTDDVSYFLIEKGAQGEDNVLCRVTEAGKHEELQTAPPIGSEIYAILELLEEEAQEQASQPEA